MLEDIIKKHLGHRMQPWLSWGDPAEPVSEYQMIYEQGAKFEDKREIEHIRKNALWCNMSII